MSFVENRSWFMTPNDPGVVTATIGATPVIGSFTDEYVEEFGVQGDAPVLACETARLPVSHGFGTAVVIDGTSYKVVGVKPDGTGFTVLVLELAE